jgi:hypothetical protein
MMWRGILKRNIEHYRALLSDQSTSIEAREVVTKLLAEAQTQLSDPLCDSPRRLSDAERIEISNSSEPICVGSSASSSRALAAASSSVLAQ